MHTFSLAKLLLPAGLLAGMAAGLADTTLRGPVLGYVLDARSHSIRAVNGIPGAATLAAPVPLPFAVERAAFSSASDFALVIGSEDRTLYLIRNLDTTAPAAWAISGALPGIDRVVLSAANTSAALYSSRDRRLQVIRGLPAHAEAGPALDLASLGGELTALAIDRDGLSVLAAFAGGEVYRVPISGHGGPVEPRPVTRLSSPSALVLFNGDRDAAIADAASHQVFLVRDFAGTAETLSLAGERDGISKPVAVEASADGRRIFVANGGSASLAVIDLVTHGVEIQGTLDGAPTRIDRLQGRSTFVLNDPGNDALLLLDLSDIVGIYFVPAGREN